MMELRDYQRNAVEGLYGNVERLIRNPENGVVIFQAPTGSGKTVMVSEMLKQLVKNRKDYKKLALSGFL